MAFSFKKEVSENDGVYAPIIPGVYNVQFDTLEEVETQTGGFKWSAKMKIVGSGRTFFLNWNVKNASESAQRIAREQITQIANLLNVPSELIDLESIKTNKIFTVTLEQRPYNDKVYYQTKGPWKLADSLNASAIKNVQDKLALPISEKKKNPWDKK
jgi:hypothetical protein